MANYVCEQCSKSFDSEKSLNLHKQQEHGSRSQSANVSKANAPEDRGNSARDYEATPLGSEPVEIGEATSHGGNYGGGTNPGAGKPFDKKAKNQKKENLNKSEGDMAKQESDADTRPRKVDK